MYVELQNKIPQNDDESDYVYLQRIKRDPDLSRKLFFGTEMFKNELQEAVALRMMMLAGAKRVGRADADGGMELKPMKSRLGSDATPEQKKQEQEKFANVKSTVADKYREEFLVGGEMQKRRAKEAYALLINQFDAQTPSDGSIFWNGVNELALAKMVDTWNKDLGPERFGALEATTAARYVNKKFVWEEGGTFQKYFVEVSGMLGHAARGHVTAVVRCGLRHDSIFTVTELPNMLGIISKQLMKKQALQITDLSIVVIQPKHLPSRKVACFTNNEITMIPIVRPVAWRINGPDDCTIDGHVGLPAAVRELWSRDKPPKKESPGARKIMKDFENLIKWP
jgi:hypothetical protein